MLVGSRRKSPKGGNNAEIHARRKIGAREEGRLGVAGGGADGDYGGRGGERVAVDDEHQGGFHEGADADGGPAGGGGGVGIAGDGEGQKEVVLRGGGVVVS